MFDYHNQICLISEQNTPDFLGALTQRQKKPKMRAIVTARMKKEAEIYKSACKSRGISCELWELERIEISAIEELLDRIYFSDPENTWAVNITGGTKIMAIAAHGWATKNGIPAFYVDTGNREIYTFENGKRRSEPLPDVADYASLLSLHGYTIQNKIESPVRPEARANLDELLEVAILTPGVVHELNYIAQSAEKYLTASYRSSDDLGKALAICKKAGKLDYRENAVVFLDEEARRWCNGVWLEQYVQAVLAGLKREKRINSWASSAEVTKNKTKNELDAIFTANNRLYVIECKTQRASGADGINAASILYKADSINGRVAGIFTQSLICSLDELNRSDMSRAKEMGIEIVCGSRLKDLRKIIIEWTGKNERN